MKCCALWYGGSNYAPPTSYDLETFRSLESAKSVFDSRFNDSYYPCVDEEAAEMHIYFGDEDSVCIDNGPDRIIRRGRRGGIVVERC